MHIGDAARRCVARGGTGNCRPAAQLDGMVGGLNTNDMATEESLAEPGAREGQLKVGQSTAAQDR